MGSVSFKIYPKFLSLPKQVTEFQLHTDECFCQFLLNINSIGNPIPRSCIKLYDWTWLYLIYAGIVEWDFPRKTPYSEEIALILYPIGKMSSEFNFFTEVAFWSHHSEGGSILYSVSINITQVPIIFSI